MADREVSHRQKVFFISLWSNTQLSGANGVLALWSSMSLLGWTYFQASCSWLLHNPHPCFFSYFPLCFELLVFQDHSREKCDQLKISPQQLLKSYSTFWDIDSCFGVMTFFKPQKHTNKSHKGWHSSITFACKDIPIYWTWQFLVREYMGLFGLCTLFGWPQNGLLCTVRPSEKEEEVTLTRTPVC